jgi:hypothetical protein
VQLEARTLEPLDDEAAVGCVLGLRIGERQAEQRQALSLAGATPPVELQAVGTPRAQDRVADIMAGFGEKATARLGRTLGESEPIAPLLGQTVGAEAAKEHVVGAGVLGVQLEAVAFEPLHLDRLAFDLLFVLIGDGEAKDRQAAVLLPKVTDTAVDTLTGLWEAALGRAGRAGRGQHK